MRKSYFIIAETLIFASTNIMKYDRNVITDSHNYSYLRSFIMHKSAFQKNGRFPNTHIEGNKALRGKKIYCARTEDRLQYEHKNLFERLKE